MITSNIQLILIVTGILTAGMLAQFIAPAWVVRHTFGDSLTGPVSITIARHWGLLLFCVGALLTYSAFHPALQEAAMVVAVVEKAGFVACVFLSSLRQRRIVSALAAADAAMVLVYVLYLAGI